MRALLAARRCGHRCADLCLFPSLPFIAAICLHSSQAAKKALQTVEKEAKRYQRSHKLPNAQKAAKKAAEALDKATKAKKSMDKELEKAAQAL